LIAASPSKKIHVVGAGFSGLHCAFLAQKQGWSVTIYDRASRCGGLIATDTIPEVGISESAANAMISSPYIEDLAEELGLTLYPAKSEAKRRYILRKGRLQRWPLSFVETLKFIFSFLIHITRLKPRKHEVLHLWAERIFGSDFTQSLLIPGLQGIYGKDPSHLSAQLVYAQFVKRFKDPDLKGRKQTYKGSVSFKGGMGELTEALEKKLRENGANLELGREVSEKEIDEWNARGEKIVISTSLSAVRSLLKNISSAFVNASSIVNFADLMSVTVFYKNNSTSDWLDGFGLLLPRSEKFEVLGVLRPTNIFPDRVVDEKKIRSETWIFRDELLKLSDEQVIHLIQEERKILSQNQSFEILSYKIYRWPKALPYYDVILERLLEQESYLKMTELGIGLVGNWTGMLSLAKMAASQKEFLRDFLATDKGATS
jgi:oxygen-dependent protoporphyrinogen oxidase